MRKLLVLSIVAFFIVFSIETAGFNYVTGDHPYYTHLGQLGQGHDLTLMVLRPMYLVLPSFVRDNALPIFINFMFVFSIYFMLKPFVKYPEWAFLLAPLMPLSTVYAQIFAISFFNFMLGFYFRGKREVAPLFLVLVFLAHYWTGLFVAVIFTMYVLAFDRKFWGTSLVPTVIIAGFFFLFMPQGIGFLTQAPTVIPPYYLTTADFFFLISRGFTFFFLSFFGLWILWLKNRDFCKINLMLLLIPLLIFVLPTSNEWDWRLLYFQPFLVLVSVLMSYLFEGKTEQSRIQSIYNKYP